MLAGGGLEAFGSITLRLPAFSPFITSFPLSFAVFLAFCARRLRPFLARLPA